MNKYREIGSEFCAVPQRDGAGLSVFPDKTQYFLSGRVALYAVIEDIRSRQVFRSVAMPSWCCHTMIEPFLRCGVEVFFYPVTAEEGGLRQDLRNLPAVDGLLLMDYFGYEAGAVTAADFEGVILRDATHSLLTSSPGDGDYIFGSLRKWAGFHTGGYAWKQQGDFCVALPERLQEDYVALRRRAMAEKEEYLAGRREDKGYLELFSRAEELLEAGASGAAEALDVQAGRQLDAAFVRRRRRANAQMLLQVVSRFALFPELGEADCPLFVPICLPEEKRDALRRWLIERKIYCPIHWPVSKIHRLTERTRRIYETELSLVCDQRYEEADMARFCAALQEFFKQERL